MVALGRFCQQDRYVFRCLIHLRRSFRKGLSYVIGGNSTSIRTEGVAQVHQIVGEQPTALINPRTPH